MGDINGHLGVRNFFFFSLCVSVCLTILFILFTNRLWETTGTIKFRVDPDLSTADLTASGREEASLPPLGPGRKLTTTTSPLPAEDRENELLPTGPGSPSREDEAPEAPKESSAPAYLYLPACDSCGLGTTMFQFASAYGVAKRNKMGLLVSPSFGLWKVFGQLEINGTMSEEAVKSSGFKRFEDKRIRVYNPELETLHTVQQNWTLGTSRLQSWKYFQDYAKDLRRQFTLSAGLRPKVESFLTQAAKEGRDLGTNSSVLPGVFVGVHVRRKGLTDGYEQQQGDLLSAEWYLIQAMSYYRRKYTNVTFIVCSDDDTEWCKSHIAAENNDVVFSEGHTAVEDLAILAACNHTVMTLGAFGWWGGWLAGGEVVYYNGGYIKADIVMDAQMTGEDYMLPKWKGMG